MLEGKNREAAWFKAGEEMGKEKEPSTPVDLGGGNKVLDEDATDRFVDLGAKKPESDNQDEEFRQAA